MKVVLCHGVFDLLHFGHIEHLRKARLFGDSLIVSVLADKYVTKRVPIYSQDERLDILISLKSVDEVILCNAPGPETILSEIRPNVYVRGSEYAEQEMPESPLLRRLGIPVRFTTSCPPHTEDVIKRIIESAHEPR